MGTPKRDRFGHGPANVYVLGGKGRPLRYENCGGDWWVHFALCSVLRLRVMTWLCTHAGEHGAAEVARGLRVTKRRAETALTGLRWSGLARARWQPGGRRITGERERYRWLWSASVEGRKYLWRYGWVTGRLRPSVWDFDTYDGPADPCDALLADAAPSLLRPTAMAMAQTVWMFSPVRTGRLAELLGISQVLAQNQLEMWERIGWAEWTQGERVTQVEPFRMRTPRVWQFRPAGYAGIERHCHALRQAAQDSGYEVPPDDRFLLGEDRVGWITYTLD